MEISKAQREVRTVYMGGFAGQLVSGILWLASAALATWSSPGVGILVLVIGGVFIFPLTQLVLRLMGRRASLSAGNELRQLAMQVAFTLPLNLPLVGAATMYRVQWFYPAFMIALGTHYIPFVFLYGMWHFAVLAILLIGAGLAIGLYVPEPFSVGGWIAGVLLLVFAFVGLWAVRTEDAASITSAPVPEAMQDVTN